MCGDIFFSYEGQIKQAEGVERLNEVKESISANSELPDYEKEMLYTQITEKKQTFRRNATRFLKKGVELRLSPI